MQRPSVSKIKQFREKVLACYKKNGRNLPWRQTTDPYAILISEIMLQQTQVDRVIPFFTTWMRKWPTMEKLAAASRKEVLRSWLGLGYNNRAMRLHNLALVVTQKYQGDLLHALSKEKLPGIGPYTSRAIRIFALNEDLITIDTNIRRILIHEFNLPHTTTNQKLEQLALWCLPKGRSRDWHNALMDYGAIILTSRKTGIRPKTIQSKFEGSDRQIRAQILRHLLKQKDSADTYTALYKLTKIPKNRLKKIIGTMIKDDIITNNKRKYKLKT